MSALLRPSWDETFWLGVARMVEQGRTLYDGAIDNKSPAVYAAVWLMDVLPGPFGAARAVIVGALVAIATFATIRLVEGQPDRGWITALFAGTVMLATDFVLTTELVAVTALAGALLSARRGRVVSAIVLGVLAASFDPRAVLIFPGVALFGRDRTTRRWLGIGLGAMTGLALAIVGSIPDLRYGLIEANLASRGLRGGIDLVEWAVALVQTALPIVLAMTALRRRPSSAAAVTLTVGAVVIGASSLHGFPHYWTYLALVPLVSAQRATSEPVRPRSRGAVLIVIAFLPAIGETATIVGAQQALWHTYHPVVEVVDGTSGSVVVWDIRPHVGALLADRNVLRSPTVHYLGWQTSRTDDHLAELPALIATADVLVDAGGLDRPPTGVAAELRPAHRILAERIEEFPCTTKIAEVTIRTRSGCAEEAS